MASAKFLEEALSTDVDESAVSAIVGSLETQLVTGATTQPSPSVQSAVPAPSSNHLPNSGNNGSSAAVAVAVAAPLTTTSVAPAPSLPKPAQQQQHVAANGTSDGSSSSAGSTNGGNGIAGGTGATGVSASGGISGNGSSQPQMVNNMTAAVVTQELVKATPTPASTTGQVTLGSVNVVAGSSTPQQSHQTQVQTMQVQQQPQPQQQLQQQQPQLQQQQQITQQQQQQITQQQQQQITQQQQQQQVTQQQQQQHQQQQVTQQQQQQHQQQQVTQQQQQQVTQQQQQQVTQQQQQQTTFINQVTSNQVTSNQTNQLTALTKVQGEHVKIVYPGSSQVIATTGVVNANNKLTFPAQNVAQLANGTLGVVTTQTVLQSTSNSVSNVSGTQTTNQATINMNKQTALVLKTTGAPGGMVSVPMSVPVSVAANMTNTVQQAKAGVTSTIVPSNLQILNVNAMRPGTPVTGQQAGKQVASRVVIGPHMMGARAGTPGITLQTLQGLQAGTQGHLLLKTENGQFQLLRVGPAPTPGTPTGTVTPNSIAGNTVVATPGATGTTYRLASLPAVSRLNAQFTGPPLATIRKPIQTVAPTVTTTTVTPVTSTIVAATTTAPTPAATPAPTTPAPTQRQATDNTKEKCRKFLANLLELSSREPKHVERNVRTLIQELIDVKVEPEEFCVRLEKLLNASPQPCLIGFLKKSLPLLRQSLVTKELVIEGIRPPPPNVVFSIATAATVAQQNQIRPTVAVAPAATVGTPTPTQVVASHATVAVSPTISTQVRVMAPPAGITNVPRPPQPIVQQRLVRPVTTVVRPPTTFAVKTTTVSAAAVQQQQQHQHQPQHSSVSTSVTNTSTGTGTIRQPTGPVIMQKSMPMSQPSKTMVITSQNKTATAPTTLNKAAVPSVQPKPLPKEKEKKTFSSAGYTGDDDINDVAAMGGVNLAEESQRILGSTKFVGTQIRSCKDEVFLHMTPLQQKINKIVTSYGLEEPNQEVASLISHAAQERLKNLVEKLAIIAEHRIDLVKVDPRYEVTQDVRAQLKFLEELDRVERKRHEEQEREVLLKAAKSRAKTEDPEQAKLKAKAKEMQRAEMEETRQREANQTALQAIGPRKKPKLDLGGSSANSSGSNAGFSNSSAGLNRQLPLRPRLKRVNFRDLLFLLEQEKETCRSATLYKSYLK